MTAPYGFGVSQEDDRIDARLLGPLDAARVVCVASGGEVPLGLAARGAQVTAVDLDPAQLHLTALKWATTLALEPADGARFLGYASADPGARRRWYPAVRAHLAPAAAAYWDAAPAVVAGGAVRAGRFERYLARAIGLLRPVWGRGLARLCAADSAAEAAAAYQDAVERPWLRLAFQVAFHPRIYGGRGISRAALAQRTDAEPLGAQALRWFRAWCTATPVADNWMLQLFLGGGLRDPERGPDFLRPAGVRALRAAPPPVLVQADLRAHLAASPPFDAVHLSNLGDWLAPAAWDDLLGAVAARSNPRARLLWRELQGERSGAALGPAWVLDRAAGQEARATDRFPFYRLVPGRRDG